MGKSGNAELVNLTIFLFGGFIEYRFKDLKEILIAEFGEIDYVSPLLDFGKYTFYYNKEMGNGPIQGILVSFEDLIHPAELANIKVRTNQIEKNCSFEGKRTVNLDPGYVHHTQFVLASTKSGGNRIYIGHGIKAEVTLIFVKGLFRPFEYTYPSYRAKECVEELMKIRKLFLSKRKKLNK